MISSLLEGRESKSWPCDLRSDIDMGAGARRQGPELVEGSSLFDLALIERVIAKLAT
jgi:hypothetical protein